MKTLRKVLLVVFLTILVFGFGFVSGCGTIHGVSSDIHEFSGAVERSLRPEMQKRQDAEISRAKAQEQENLKKATKIVLNNSGN